MRIRSHFRSQTRPHLRSQLSLGASGAVQQFAPLDPDARLAFGFPQGDTGPVLESATWTNLFGNGTTFAGGAIAIKIRQKHGLLFQDPKQKALLSLTAPWRVFGALQSTDGVFNGFGLSFFPASASVADNPSRPNGYAWTLFGPGASAAIRTVGGSTAWGSPFLLAPVLDVSDQGTVEALMILHHDGAGRFRAFAIQPGDTSWRVGDDFTNLLFQGVASTAVNVRISGQGWSGGAFSTLNNRFTAGDLSNVIHTTKSDGGTEAEWLRVANGESPAVVFSGNIACWYRMGNHATDLA